MQMIIVRHHIVVTCLLGFSAVLSNLLLMLLTQHHHYATIVRIVPHHAVILLMINRIATVIEGWAWRWGIVEVALSQMLPLGWLGIVLILQVLIIGTILQMVVIARSVVVAWKVQCCCLVASLIIKLLALQLELLLSSLALRNCQTVLDLGWLWRVQVLGSHLGLYQMRSWYVSIIMLSHINSLVIIAEFLFVTKAAVTFSLTASTAPKTAIVIWWVLIWLDGILVSFYVLSCHWIHLRWCSSHHVVLSNV